MRVVPSSAVSKVLSACVLIAIGPAAYTHAFMPWQSLVTWQLGRLHAPGSEWQATTCQSPTGMRRGQRFVVDQSQSCPKRTGHTLELAVCSEVKGGKSSGWRRQTCSPVGHGTLERKMAATAELLATIETANEPENTFPLAGVSTTKPNQSPIRGEEGRGLGSEA
jgi:hypothetical protein